MCLVGKSMGRSGYKRKKVYVRIGEIVWLKSIVGVEKDIRC